jgi:RNA polymerase sigma factor (sigma-70 family)
MKEKSDPELIETFINGDVSGFNELVRRYQERIYWIARRTVGTHEDAADVVQDVFIRVYNGLKNFRGESNFYTWLYRITVNVALNAIRRKRIKEILPYDELLEGMPASESKTDDPIQKQEFQTILEKAVQTLPTKQRMVFTMRYYEELPYEDIAKILKKSVGGTKANYFQALKKVSKYVRREFNI